MWKCCRPHGPRVTLMGVSFPGAHGVFSLPGQRWPGFFLRADENTSALRALRAPGFFSDCGRNFAYVRWDCLLRTGEPCDPRSRHSPTGDFFGFCAWENRVCRNGAARERTMTDHRM